MTILQDRLVQLAAHGAIGLAEVVRFASTRLAALEADNARLRREQAEYAPQVRPFCNKCGHTVAPFDAFHIEQMTLCRECYRSAYVETTTLLHRTDTAAVDSLVDAAASLIEALRAYADTQDLDDYQTEALAAL